jgi:radical S-adenosyl methionine domain-containing protein 2
MHIPETVNLHIWPKCNLKCTYCYGGFPDQPGSLPGADWCTIIALLASAGVRRVTFSGGEPTLHRDLEEMLSHARRLAVQTSIITNGARLSDAMLAQLDLVGMNLDSSEDAVQARLGRSLPRGRSYREHLTDIVQRARRHGARVKLNTVVTSLNVDEDLSAAILALRPEKWKAMQFVHVPGENDDSATALQVTSSQFDTFVARHRRVGEDGIWFVPETAATIQTTYVMVDPMGRLFQHGPEGHALSAPLLAVGLREAMASVGGYDRAQFVARGGAVDVRRLPLLKGNHQ